MALWKLMHLDDYMYINIYTKPRSVAECEYHTYHQKISVVTDEGSRRYLRLLACDEGSGGNMES